MRGRVRTRQGKLGSWGSSVRLGEISEDETPESDR